MASKAERGFVDQYTRKRLVEWARQTIVSGQIAWPTRTSAEDGVFRDHAIGKGWLSKDGSRVLAKGFDTAAAYLRR